MTEIMNLAYTDGKFIKIERITKPEAPRVLLESSVDQYAPATSSKGRHAEFRGRRKSLRNRRH